eukprot:2405718-Ditylum_brightwellii.AAC.1
MQKEKWTAVTVTPQRRLIKGLLLTLQWRRKERSKRGWQLGKRELRQTSTKVVQMHKIKRAIGRML